MTKIKDELHAKFLSNFYKHKRDNEYKHGKSVTRRFLETEVPYNFYGERGTVDCVDFYSYMGNEGKVSVAALYELKTDLVDIGETIRQVKKAQQFFLKGSHIQIETSQRVVTFSQLVILNTKSNIMKYWEHKDLFNGSNVNGLFFDIDCTLESRINFHELEWINSNNDGAKFFLKNVSKIESWGYDKDVFKVKRTLTNLTHSTDGKEQTESKNL